MMPKLRNALPNAPTPDTGDWHSTAPWVRFGNRTVLWLVGGLFVFTSLVSISGAVIATGTVTVEGNYKNIQHLEGGIVRTISVANGDRVAEGDVLIELDDTSVKANLSVTNARVHDLLIREARLAAERDRRDSFAIPSGITAADPDVLKTMKAQRAVFDANRTALAGEVSVLTQRLGQLDRETTGLQAQLDARRKEKRINADELALVLPLFEKGYVNQQRVAPLRREAARLEGEIGRLEAEIAKMDGATSETDLRIAQIEKAYTQKVVDELQQVQATLGEQKEAQKAQTDTLQRIVIRAPHAGIIHALGIHTEGGVITPATTIAQIVPEGGELRVEARLSPRDIDKVRPGLTAKVNFSAFNARTTPQLTGRVVKISPAELTNEQGAPYFTAQIEIPAAELQRIGKAHKLIPGMPADVFMETEQRSILSYFVKPLADAMTGAMRER